MKENETRQVEAKYGENTQRLHCEDVFSTKTIVQYNLTITSATGQSMCYGS